MKKIVLKGKKIKARVFRLLLIYIVGVFSKIAFPEIHRIHATLLKQNHFCIMKTKVYIQGYEEK